MRRRHAPYHSLLAVLMLCSALAGCGQKGPLFLPPGTPPPPWKLKHPAKPAKAPAAGTAVAAPRAATSLAPATATSAAPAGSTRPRP